MSTTFNVYIDESGHLEHDTTQVAVFGCVWAPVDRVPEIHERLRELKEKNGLSRAFETKFTKVSPAKERFYLDTLDYFFDDDDLRYRAVVIRDKSKLDHAAHDQTHDGWYFKMLFQLLQNVVDNTNHYRIYLDVKDTRSAERAASLLEIVRRTRADHEGIRVERLQVVRSDEVGLLQLCDLLTGIVGYANRVAPGSTAKHALVERMRRRSRYTLQKTTPLREEKTNLFFWDPSVR